MRNIMFWLKQENAHLPRFCGIFKLLARPLPKSLEKIKIPVKTDIIENNISLTVICETIFLHFVAKWGTLVEREGGPPSICLYI